MNKVFIALRARKNEKKNRERKKEKKKKRKKEKLKKERKKKEKESKKKERKKNKKREKEKVRFVLMRSLRTDNVGESVSPWFACCREECPRGVQYSIRLLYFCERGSLIPPHIKKAHKDLSTTGTMANYSMLGRWAATTVVVASVNWQGGLPFPFQR